MKPSRGALRQARADLQRWLRFPNLSRAAIIANGLTAKHAVAAWLIGLGLLMASDATLLPFLLKPRAMREVGVQGWRRLHATAAYDKEQHRKALTHRKPRKGQVRNG